MNTLAFAKTIIELLPLVINGVTEAIEIAQWGRKTLKTMIDEDRNPTEQEWSELNRRNDELLKRLL